MLPMTTLLTLDEVRSAIDRIDGRIVTLLARRQAHVRAAARHKADEDAVRAPERRAQIMRRLQQLAVGEGVDPEVVERIYTALIDAFIDLELRERRASDDPNAAASGVKSARGRGRRPGA